MVNLVILVGNLGADPELKSTQDGTAVCSLRLATTEKRKVGDEWKDVTEWHSVTVWGRTAEAVAQYNSKGSRLYVKGRLQTRKWQDKQGNDRYTTEVVADEVKFLGGGKGGEDRGGDNRGRDTNSGGGNAGTDDEIPF